MVARGESNVVFRKRKYFEEEELEEHAELLPGIPNEVTLQLICTKLPWRTFHVLSSVSHVWLAAIRSGEINDSRVRSGTAETLALLECFTDSREWAIALYSLRDKAVYVLPRLPPFENMIMRVFEGVVAIRGKMYFVGAWDQELWVLDVAGQRKWQKCANMHSVRVRSRCAVFEGKLYVFGGFTRDRHPIDFSEVYDPEVDVWTKISPMKSARMSYSTCIVGDEILIHSGCVFDASWIIGTISENCWRPTMGSTHGMEAYNPAKDSWRTIPPGDFRNQLILDYWGTKPEILFSTHGRLHCLSERKIEIIDLGKRSGKDLQSCSVKARSNISHSRGRFSPAAVLATNDGFVTSGVVGKFNLDRGTRLYQSTKFGKGKKRIVLEEVETPPSVRFFDSSYLEPIQL